MRESGPFSKGLFCCVERFTVAVDYGLIFGLGEEVTVSEEGLIRTVR